MRFSMKSVFYWLPRVLGVLFAVFVSLFALDVFGVGYGFWETILAYLIHMVPVYLILIALAIGWRWEPIGGMLFIGLALLYIAMAWGQFSWMVYLTIAGPAVLIGLLFLFDWRYRAGLQPTA